ncbi:hypothetical protein QEH58_18080, partial [Roseibacillus persicicus]
MSKIVQHCSLRPSSPNGANKDSPGQRPGLGGGGEGEQAGDLFVLTPPVATEQNVEPGPAAPVEFRRNTEPSSPNGAKDDSPGQRPGLGERGEGEQAGDLFVHTPPAATEQNVEPAPAGDRE